MCKIGLSIVLGTYNRVEFLKPCIEAARRSVLDLPYEIIVVDGGSTDGAREYLARQSDVVLLGEWCLEGACKAFNKGFSLARFPYVAHLNDDALCEGPVLAEATQFLHDRRDVAGQVAIPIEWSDGEFRVDHVLGLLYANMGVTQRWLGDYVGWWGDYHTYGGDCDLSLKIWRLGYQVLELPNGRIRHSEVDDELRRRNPQDPDAWKFFSRWRSFRPPARPLISPECAHPVLTPFRQDVGARLRPSKRIGAWLRSKARFLASKIR